MNRKQLREELAFLLNFTEGTADQDFVTNRLNKGLDRAYNQIVERAKLHGGSAYFRGVTANFTWAASAQTLAVPVTVSQFTIEDVYNITAGEPGFPLVFGNDAAGGDLFWKDNVTWQWGGTGGPGSAMTLRAVVQQTAENLTELAEPQLIPAQFHWLIVWQAAVLMRLAADEKAPADWKEQFRELTLDYQKYVSRGRPLSLVPSIVGGSGAGSGPTTFNVAGFGNSGDGLSPP